MSDAAQQQNSNDISSTQANDASSSSTSQNVSSEGLRCEWQGCTTRTSNAEQLYDHVCEAHVGRKSTNNLNLTCHWGNCRTSTVKRDHITSHIRVHVPLKPHKCDYCGKAFKRPQDLKKHVKTHAEEPNYPGADPQQRQHPNGPGVFGNPSSRHVTDLQHMAATATGYYPDGQHLPSNQQMYPGYANGGAAAAPAYHGSGGYQQANYMTAALYPVTASQQAEYELKKRATFDALNEFFGDLKNKELDPRTYHAVGSRLMSLEGAPGYLGPAAGYGAGGAGTAVAPAPHAGPSGHYAALSHLRTKPDLESVDRYLEQLQTTVYEHETHAAITGVQIPGIHTIPTHPRRNVSPPRPAGFAPQPANTLPPIGASSSSALNTPALTPASSEVSYSSPGSSTVDRVSLSPTNRPSLMYPAVTAHDAHVYHQMATSAAAAAGAAATALPAGMQGRDAYGGHHRHFGAGELQRARPPAAGGGAEEAEEALLPNIARLGVRSPSVSNVDPALWDARSQGSSARGSKGSATPTPASKEEEREGDPEWIVKVRVLEALREYVRHRLDNHLWEEEGEGKSGEDARSLYPVIRAVRGEE